jgi:alkylated DNA repair dioxygenase AlkB
MKPGLSAQAFSYNIMDTLFPLTPAWPPGFIYHPHFIDAAEEEYLIDEIGKIELHTFLFHGYEAKRRVASFGFDYTFDKRSISKGKDIPQAFNFLIDKVARYMKINREDFAELLVTEYPVGAVINWHRDAPPFDIIAGISLFTDCTFRLRPHEKAKQRRGSIVSLNVQRRSMYIIRDEARTAWEHSIMPVKSTRYSITLRTLRARA